MKNERKTLKQFIHDSNKIHNNKYDYSKNRENLLKHMGYNIKFIWVSTVNFKYTQITF